jgi:hypothetical protein
MKLRIQFVTLFLLLLASLMGQAQSVMQKPKRIYITLDVSGSMKGNKYIIANYAAQSIAVFSDPDDQVFLYYLGKPHNISGNNGYKQIQKPFNSLTGQNTYHEISDLSQFLKDYHPDTRYQDWLFIIGDGQWDYSKARAEYDRTTNQLKQRIEGGTLQLCYLQTGDLLTEENPFTSFLGGLNAPVIDIKTSDTTAASVLGHCVYFANRILGFSNTSVQLQQQGEQCATFRSEFPLERCLLVYQSSQPIANETRMVSATCDEGDLSTKVKGNPSTKPLVAAGKPVINGMVWELSSPQTISANSTVTICFNQDVEVNNLKLYPYVDVALVMRPWTVAMDTLVQAAANCFSICDQENKVLVQFSATDQYGRKFSPKLMQQMEVKFVIAGKEIKAAYTSTDTTFQAVMAMPDDTLSYFSLVECPGYFSMISSHQTVVKDASACPPEKVPLITLPLQRFEAVDFKSLSQENGFGGPIEDPLFKALVGKGTFDELSLSGHDSWMLERAELSFQDGQIVLVQHPRSEWCECAFPDTLSYQVTLRSRKGLLYEDKLYEGFVVPVKVPVERRGWWNRCWVYLAALGGLLLVFLYLRALKRKRRFGKDSGIKSIYFDRYGEEVDDNYQLSLRKEGLGAWLARWFWPGDEKNVLSFVDPELTSMRFVAGDSINIIRIPRGSIDPSTVAVDGYDFENENNMPDYIKLTNNSRIEVLKNSEVKAGYLMYVAGHKTGDGWFRFLSSLLMIATFAAGAFVIWTLVKSLF